MQERRQRIPERSARVGRAGLLPLLALAAGCYWSPTEQERLEDSVVVTARDQATDLGTYRSFFLRPQIRILAEDNGVPNIGAEDFVPDPVAAPILNATSTQLLERGYTEASSSDEADIAVDLVYVRNAQSDFYCTYWGDWAYWGFPGWSYYFPYPCGTSSWYSGMLVTHAVDLVAARQDREARPDTLGMMRGLWLSGVYGAEVESVSFVTARAVEGVDEAFEQSPYFVRTPGTEPAPDSRIE